MQRKLFELSHFCMRLSPLIGGTITKCFSSKCFSSGVDDSVVIPTEPAMSWGQIKKKKNYLSEVEIILPNI